MPEETTLINLEQVRAKAAFECASTLDRNLHKDFLSLARSLPAMFQGNGLLATWAFLLSKEKREVHYKKVLQVMVAHLRWSDFGFGIDSNDTAESLFLTKWTGGSSTMSPTRLMALTAEAIVFSGWLKRAAEALCQPQEGEGGAE